MEVAIVEAVNNEGVSRFNKAILFATIKEATLLSVGLVINDEVSGLLSRFRRWRLSILETVERCETYCLRSKIIIAIKLREKESILYSDLLYLW